MHRELILQVGPRRMLLRQDLKSQLNLHPNLHINLLLTPLDLSLHPHNQLTELQLHGGYFDLSLESRWVSIHWDWVRETLRDIRGAT